METRKLTIGDRTLILESVEAAGRTRTAIESALHRGGGFVDVPILGALDVAVLITDHSQVAIERVVFEDPPAGSGGVPPSGSGLEYDL